MRAAFGYGIGDTVGSVPAWGLGTLVIRTLYALDVDSALHGHTADVVLLEYTRKLPPASRTITPAAVADLEPAARAVMLIAARQLVKPGSVAWFTPAATEATVVGATEDTGPVADADLKPASRPAVVPMPNPTTKPED